MTHFDTILKQTTTTKSTQQQAAQIERTPHFTDQLDSALSLSALLHRYLEPDGSLEGQMVSLPDSRLCVDFVLS